MGLTEVYFYSLTPRVFSNILKGFRRNQESAMRLQWEIGRHIMWSALAPHGKKGSQMRPDSVLKFPWDAISDSDKVDLEKLKAQVAEKNIAFWDRWDAKRSGKPDC